jgi:REP element-mobilizing transposase RayT
MPRMARLKDKESIYHVMVRSIKEVNLFESDDDKIRYLEIVKRYMEKYKFKVYAYCLMLNHGHLMIDANGADISCNNGGPSKECLIQYKLSPRLSLFAVVKNRSISHA